MVSRVVNLLESDDIVTKEGSRGRIVSVDWETLAARWAEDYEFSRSNTPTTWLEPRGAAPLLARLRGAEFRYAVTGSLRGESLGAVRRTSTGLPVRRRSPRRREIVGAAPRRYRGQRRHFAPLRPSSGRARRT